MATPTIVFAPQALDILRQAASRHATLMHDDAVGGLLIGKRDGERIVVLAASEPGPNADDRRLGVALDVGYINALLEAWFEHDPTVDLVGMWHTHPQDLLELTLDDVAAAYTLREDGGNEIVSAIALAGDDPVRCFYLDAVSTGTVGLVSVPYRVEGDAPVLTPVMPIVVAPSAPVVVAPVVETAAEGASPPTAPDTTRTTDDAWTTDETDLALNPPRTERHDPVLPARPRPSALMVFGVIAVLLLFGLWRFFTLERPMVPTASAPTVTVASVGAAVVATVEPSPALPATATLVPPTATTGATATPPATPTQAATLAPTEAAPVVASATVETTARCRSYDRCRNHDRCRRDPRRGNHDRRIVARVWACLARDDRCRTHGVRGACACAGLRGLLQRRSDRSGTVCRSARQDRRQNRNRSVTDIRPSGAGLRPAPGRSTYLAGLQRARQSS